MPAKKNTRTRTEGIKQNCIDSGKICGEYMTIYSVTNIKANSNINPERYSDPKNLTRNRLIQPEIY